jgi:archaetidylinositol phosphate synthase
MTKLTETAVVSSKKPETPIKEGTQKAVESFVNATRIQESMTSGLESKALFWMACRMPSWVSSDQLTLLGFVAMFLAGGSYLLARWHPIGLLAATVCYVDWRIAMGMLIAFLLLSIETYLASYTLGIFRLSFAKVGPTEIRILLALGNFVLWFRPNIRAPGVPWRLLDFAGVIAITVMGLMVAAATVWHTAELYRQETLR